MKNFKRILALVLTLMFIVGSCASLSAYTASSKWYKNATDWIESNGIDTIGATADKEIDRNTFAMWIAKIESTYVSDDLWDDRVDSTTFADVKPGEHYYAAIAYAEESGFIEGDGDGNFYPSRIITFAEACAIITRVMGYEDYFEAYYGADHTKYTTYDEWYKANWQINYMRVVNLRCKAIDQTWVKEVGEFVPQHKLTKGEAAYLLYTLAHTGANVRHNGQDMGYKLGSNFDDHYTTVNKLALVKTLARKPLNGNALLGYESGANVPLNNHVMMSLDNEYMSAYWTKRNYQIADECITPYSKILDTSKEVVLQLFDGENFVTEYTMNATKFQSMIRKSLGLKPEVDTANEEVFYLFDYVRAGSVVNLTVSSGEVTGVTTVDSHTVDTYRILNSTNNYDYYLNGLANAFGDAGVDAVLPKAYDAEKDIAVWSGNNLVFQGTTYAVRSGSAKYQGIANEIKVYGYEKVQATETIGGKVMYKYYEPRVTMVPSTDTEVVAWKTYYKVNTTGTGHSFEIDGVKYDKVGWDKNARKMSATQADLDAGLYYDAVGGETHYSEYENRTYYCKANNTCYTTVQRDELIAAGTYTAADFAAINPYMVEGNLVQLTVAEAKEQLINAAQGEATVVYSDMDGDGKYDIAVVTEYDHFFIAGENLSTPSDDPVKGVPGAGSILLNISIDDDRTMNTDAWRIPEGAKATGKVRLVFNVQDRRGATGLNANTYYAGYRCALKTTNTAADVLSFSSAYIQTVTSEAKNGYYTVEFNIPKTDAETGATTSEIVKAYLPAFGYVPVQQTITYKYAGASADYTVDSSNWMTFVTDFYKQNFSYVYRNAANNAFVYTYGTEELSDAAMDKVAFYEKDGAKVLVTAAEKAALVDAGTVAEDAFKALTLKVYNGKGLATETAIIKGEGYNYQMVINPTTDEGIYKLADAESVNAMVSAWVNNKFINYVLDADSKIIYAAKTESTALSNGFVVSATKKDGDANVYDVVATTTGLANNKATTYYATGVTTLDQITSRIIYVKSSSGYTNDANGYRGALNTKDFAIAKAKENFALDPATAITFYVGKSGAYQDPAKYDKSMFIAQAKLSDSSVTTFEQAMAKVITGQIGEKFYGAAGLGTYTVRASASTIWDVANAATYRRIFSGYVTDMLDTGATVTANDFYYVSMTKDAGSNYIMRMTTAPGTVDDGDVQYAAGIQMIMRQGTTGNPFGWTFNDPRIFHAQVYTIQSKVYEANSVKAWQAAGVLSYDLTTKKTSGTAPAVTDAAKSMTKTAAEALNYTETYDILTGTEPYYRVKSASANANTFEVVFKSVSKVTKTVNYTAYPVNAIDGIYVKAIGPDGNVIKGDAQKAMTLTAAAENTTLKQYYSFGGEIHIEVEPASKFNYVKADGNINYVTNTTLSETEIVATDAKLESYDVAKANLNVFTTLKAMERTDDGFIPGYYHVKLNNEDRSYTAAGSTKVVVMTPSNDAKKVVGAVTTLKDIADGKLVLFATGVQLKASGDKIQQITVIGEFVGDKADPTPDPTPADTSKIVFVGSDVTAELIADETGKSYIVTTDKPVYALDGTEFGYIRYEFDTTSDKFPTTNVKFLIKAGSFYRVDKDGKIISNLGSMFGSTTKTGTQFIASLNSKVGYSYDMVTFDNNLDANYCGEAKITKVTSDSILATVDGKTVDISKWNTKFIYTDIDATKLYLAGDNTNVGITGFSQILDNLNDYYKSVALAKAIYDKAVELGRSAEKLAEYKATYDAAVEALEAAKESNVSNSMNGAFWGTTSVDRTALKRYFDSVKYTYGGEDASLKFNYLKVGDVYYVIVPSFVKG